MKVDINEGELGSINLKCIVTNIAMNLFHKLRPQFF